MEKEKIVEESSNGEMHDARAKLKLNKDLSQEEETEEAKDIKEYWADMKSRTNSRHRTRSRSKTPIRGLHRSVLGLMLITVPTAEALNLQTSIPTLTAHLPPIWLVVPG
jgi:hypothetical protein